MYDLATKYRPASLTDLYGQDDIVSFFRSVLNKKEESPRYYLLSGAFGTGKTSIARAFARDLLGSDYKSSPNYIEIDSSEKVVADNFEMLRELIFAETPGWKVVLIDEAHLLPQNTSQLLLKVLEDYVGRLFIFFCTTDPQLLFPPLTSRLYKFSLSLFTQEQCVDYAKSILKKENVSLSDKTLALCALNSQGHLRDCAKQLDMVLFQGEEKYLETYQTIWNNLELFFFDFDLSADEVVQKMFSHHPVQLRAYLSFYLREYILSPKAPRYDQVYPANMCLKIFQVYLKFMSLLKEDTDYFSFLLEFRLILEKTRKQ